jgi:Domain of unknown function (DUF4340)
MNEMTKTITFVAVALVSLAAGWATRPSTAVLDVKTLVGEVLAKNFTDPAEAKRLRVVKFNEDSATLRDFEVAEQDGLWSIPSKDGYPADAEKQMAEAATSLMDRKILGVASESAGDHEQFGVIDPQSPKLEVGQKGVGTHVTISDIRKEPLVDLIIGKEVKDSPSQHYVREAGRDVVYVVDLNPERLSTNFDDWIEKDLLKLSPWEIEKIQIKDYSAELQPVMTDQGLAIQVAWEPRSDMTVGYDDKAAKWTPIELKKFEKGGGDYVPFQLAADEELNTKKLDELKTSLDDLKIVDVVKKPAGLSADLKAGGDFLNNADARQDLRSRGFAAIPARNGGEGQDIISNEGEVLCTLINGVEYVLRFGDLRMASGDDAKQPAKDAVAADKAKAKSTDKNVQRYLFAMARFNEDAVKKPELAELPALPEGAEDKVATEGDKDTKDGSQPDAKDAEKVDKAAESASAEGSQSDAKPAGDQKATDEKSEEVKKVIAERKQIEAENQHKLNEYQAKLEKGRQTVKDLNLRFGDWYFVVSNDVFQKVRLDREDAIKKKDAKDDKAGDKKGASSLGLPGQPIPGLPSIPGAGG